MENRLQNLKKALKQNVFSEIEFNEVSKNLIHKAISELEECDEDLYYAIFQILREERSGFELHARLRNRGITKFVEKEGSLYMLLHELEQKEYLRAFWLVEKKMYVLAEKGRKMMKQAEKKKQSAAFILQSILGGS